MPFFGHIDILSEARRIYFWDQSGIYVDDITRNATSLFQLLFYKVFSLFLHNESALFAIADISKSTASPTEYFEFVSNTDIFRTVFIIKLPFMTADLVTAWCVYRLCGANHNARRATVLWLFNPLMLFAVYFFGRFESIPVMFCALSLLALHNKRALLAAIAIGLSVNSREIFIFLGPVFVAMMCSRGAREYSIIVRIVASAIALFAVGVAVQLISLTESETTALGYEVTSIVSEGRVEYLFKFIIGSFLMFPMAYFVILLYAWNNDADIQLQAPLLFGLVLISFLVFSSHTAHYTSWFALFPCIYFASNPKLFKPIISLFVCWFVYNIAITDLGVFTTWLASPLSIHFAGIPHFPELYHAFGMHNSLDLLTFGRIWSTFYRACLIYLGVQMFLTFWRQAKVSNVNKV